MFRWAEWTIIHLRPRYFLQRITPAPGNCGDVKSQKVCKCSVATERSVYLSPAKWKSLKLEFGWAVLEQGPRASLLQLMNAEGKPQMFANITTGGNGKQSQTHPGLLRLGQTLPVATKHFYIKSKDAVDSYFLILSQLLDQPECVFLKLLTQSFLIKVRLGALTSLVLTCQAMSP